MRTEQFKKIESHPLRQVLRNVCNDPRDLPTRSELRAAIDEACPPGTDQTVKDALFTKAQEFAKVAIDRAARFDLRSAADRLTLHVVETWEKSELLLPPEDTEPEDVSGTLDAMDNWNPGERGIRALNDSLKAGEIETAKKLAGS